MRHVRQQITFGKLIKRTGKLIDIFADNTASDIRSGSDLQAAAQAGSCGTGRTDQAGPLPRPPGSVVRVRESSARSRRRWTSSCNVSSGKGPLSRQRKKAPNARDGKKRKKTRKDEADRMRQSPGASRPALADRDVGFPVYYPKKLAPGSSYVDAPRTYRIKPEGKDKRVGAYRMVIFTGFIGEYYGVQGMRWRNPPILEKPSETRTIARPQVPALLQRRSAAAGGLEDEARLVLGFQHPAPEPFPGRDARRRPLAHPRRLTVQADAAA